MSWKDREFERKDEQIYPYIYWVNIGSSLDPRREGGGFAMKLEQAKVLGAQISSVLMKHHHDDAYSEIHFAGRLEIAVLATRFSWLTKDNQVLPGYQPGAHGKLHALSLVRDINGLTVGPVIITTSGTTSKAFSNALRQHKAQVQGITSGQAPSYAFFGLYGAAGTEMVGGDQQSRVTRLAYSRYDLDPDAAYVGDAALDSLDWEAFDEWAAAWKTDESAEIPMITDSQKGFLGQLLMERGLGESNLECPVDAMTKAMASKAIEKIKAMPKKDIAEDLMDEVEALGGVIVDTGPLDLSEPISDKWGWAYQTALSTKKWDRPTTIARLKEEFGDVTQVTTGQFLGLLERPDAPADPDPVKPPAEGPNTAPPEPDLGWDEEIPF